MDFLVWIGNACLAAQPVAMWGGGVVVGVFAWASVTGDGEDRWRFARLAIVTLGATAAPSLIFNNFVQPSFPAASSLPASDWVKFIAGLAAAGLAVIFWLRWVTPLADRLAARATRATALERNEKTDVRRIEQFLPAPVGKFDPTAYWRPDGFFLGLDSQKKPVSWRYVALKHVQVAGTTGSGKGVVLAMLASQCLARGEAVFFLDPKNDEWAPHVLAHVAAEAGKPFHFVDLRPSAGAQVNPLTGATADEIHELFLAAFSLSEKGSDADFYRLADRQAAKRMAAAAAAGGGLTAAQLLERFGAELRETAPGFAGYLQEMAELPAVNAGPDGLDLEKIINDGGAVYFVGSMRNAAVLRMQRMLLVMLIQLAERRDRTAGAPRQVCIVLDELKYHISRPALEALGAARDKGVHLVLAHQSLADLRDCPADLNPEAVVGAIMENCPLKIVYRVEDPDTATWLARKSGTIQADDETRRVVRNAALAERVEGERTIRQTEAFLVDENQILNLHPGQAVLYGVGLPQFIFTSPVACVKTTLLPRVVAGYAAPDPAQLISSKTTKSELI